MTTLKRITRLLTEIATVAVVGVILVTIADILMQNVFKRPIKGAFEVVEFLLVFVIFFGMPDVFLGERNICVDVVDHAVGARGRSLLQTMGALLSLVFLIILGWAMVAPAWDTIDYPQWTQEAGIPLFAIWAPILVGVAAAIVAAATVFVIRLRGAAR